MIICTYHIIIKEKPLERERSMKLNYNNDYYPCKDVVFSIMFGKSYLFCELVSAITNDKVVLNEEPHYQASLREDDVLLNSIRFDTFAKAKNEKFYTADMQRQYKESRLERRTIYYG